MCRRRSRTAPDVRAPRETRCGNDTPRVKESNSSSEKTRWFKFPVDLGAGFVSLA